MSRAPKAVDGLSFTADDLVAMRGANEAAKAARAARGGDLFGYKSEAAAQLADARARGMKRHQETAVRRFAEHRDETTVRNAERVKTGLGASRARGRVIHGGGVDIARAFADHSNEVHS